MRQSFGNRRADGREFRVFPAYVDCASADAFAAEVGDLHLCGVTIGLAVSFFEFSLFCFSQASMFEDLGNLSDEESPSPIDGYPPGFWMREPGATLNEDAFLAQARTLLPHDPDRYTLAILLASLMTRFVWFHELFHCLNGHVGLIGSRGSALSFHENQVREKAGLTAHDLMRLEFDADQSAFHVACKVQLAEIENIEALQNLPKRTRLQLTIFAAYATTWIIEEYNSRLDQTPSSDHPDPYQRLHNLIRTLASNLAPEIADVSSLHECVLAEMDNLASLVPRFPSGKRMLADMMQSEWQDRLDQHQVALQEMREDLEPFRFTRHGQALA